MPPSTIAARSIVLAALGFAGSGAAFAQIAPAANVAAFNPYTSGGWGSAAGQPRAYPGNVPAVPAATAAPIFNNGGPTATVGAFNPWRAQTQAPATISPYGTYVDDEPGANLPAVPPGPIRSRLLAVPQRGEGAAGPRTTARVNSTALNNATRPQAVTVAARARAPAPLPMAVASTPRAPAPAPVAAAPAPVAPPPAPVAQAPAAPPPAAAPAPRPAAMAAAAPPPRAPEPAPAPPARTAGTAATVIFTGQSAELTDAGRAALDSLAQTIATKNTRQIELRAYAGGNGPESRKVSLARALAVRSYLIDRGVKSRIDVGAFLAETPGGANERVDVLAPNT